MFHVFWLCYEACKFYIKHGSSLTPRRIKNLLLAAMFHDFDHSGRLGDDDLNITRAIRALERCILPEDKPWLEEISHMMRVTEFPYVIADEKLNLYEQIIRDADMSQSFNVAWVQQVIFGLASEWNKKPIEVFKLQEPFINGIKFRTEWTRQTFPQEVIVAKIAEAKGYIQLLEGEIPSFQVAVQRAA